MSGTQSTPTAPQKYVVLGPSGNPLAFYDSVLSPPPANSGAVEISTATWAAWIINTSGQVLVNGVLQAVPVPPPSLARQAVAIILAGLTVTSTSTPALNGTYAADSDTTDHIQAEMLSLMARQTFADGGLTVAWPDIQGAVHTFPSGTLFQAFAVAIGAFVAAGYKVANGTSTTLPAAAVTIP